MAKNLAKQYNPIKATKKLKKSLEQKNKNKRQTFLPLINNKEPDENKLKTSSKDANYKSKKSKKSKVDKDVKKLLSKYKTSLTLEKLRCIDLNSNVDDNLKTASLLTLQVEKLINKYKHKNFTS